MRGCETIGTVVALQGMDASRWLTELPQGFSVVAGGITIRIDGAVPSIHLYQ